ncbi:MAG: FAD-dependent oxidoreductase, partial [Kiritimatiellae bacterium]|nr:FAD-dependent oxidoreductase [Kiritimatiellia bacterium]
MKTRFTATLLVLAALPAALPAAEVFDVLVAGGSTMGVAAAEAAAKAGAKVLLVEPGAYLGADLAGKLRLRVKTLRGDWPPTEALDTQLYRAFADPVGETRTVTPLRIKQICDRKLLDNRIPFRTWTYPCRVVKDSSGGFAGVVVAGRGGFETIAARTLIDATEFGRVAELAGSRFTAFPKGTAEFRRGFVTGEPAAYLTRGFSAAMADFSARGFAAVEQAARDATWDPAALDAADTLSPARNRALLEDAIDIRANYSVIEERQKIVQSDPECVGYILWPESSHTDTLCLKYFTANAWSKDAVPVGNILDEFCASRYGALAGQMKAIWEKVLPASMLRDWDANYGRLVTGSGESLPPCDEKT